MSLPNPIMFLSLKKVCLRPFLPLSSHDEAENGLFPRQVACIKDDAELILGEKKEITFGNHEPSTF